MTESYNKERKMSVLVNVNQCWSVSHNKQYHTCIRSYHEYIYHEYTTIVYATHDPFFTMNIFTIHTFTMNYFNINTFNENNFTRNMCIKNINTINTLYSPILK